MPLSFDDLIPQGQAAPPQAAPVQTGGLSFDDLIPKKDEGASFNDRFAASDQPAPPQTTLAGMGKSLASGVGEGAIGLAGLPGDIADLGSRGIDALAGTNTNQTIGPYAKKIGSENLQRHVEELTGPFYHGQTPTEQGIETIGQFAPALLGGPEAIGSKVLTRMVAPGLASEAAGEATKGTAAEPFARLGGALLGGGAAGAAMGAKSLAAPTEAALSAAKDAQYNSTAVKDLRIKPEGISALVNSIKDDLLNNKIDPIGAPKTTAILNNLAGSARFEAPTTQTKTVLSGPGFHIADDTQKAAPYQVQDLDLARQSLTEAGKDEPRAAAIVRKNIDKYLGTIPDSDVVSGDATAANKALLDARGNTGALKRSQDIDKAFGRAENQAASTASGHGLDNTTRQQLRPILNQKTGVSKVPGFEDYTDPEIGALRNAANGTYWGNFVRGVGKQLGGGGGVAHTGISMTAGFGAHDAGASVPESILFGLGAGLAGRGVGAYANRLTANRTNALTDLLRQRSPLAQQQAATMGQPGILGNIPPALIAQALANSHPLRLTIPGNFGQQSRQ